MVLARTLLAASLAATLACSVGTSDPFLRISLEDGFELSLAPWEPDGTDLEDPPVTWSIERSDERAFEGSWSARLRLDNLNDQGKIWIERGVGNLEPNRDFEIEISFMLGTADFGTVNLWRVIAGAAQANPEAVADLTFQDDTGNGSPTDVGFQWVEKRYTFDARTSPEGMLWFAIGIWGTSEFSRTYYIDRVRIVATRS